MISEFQDIVFYLMNSFLFVYLDYNKYENVLEYLDSGIMLFDSNGVLMFINV